MYIQIVSNLQLSLAGFKNFPVHMHLMIRIQIHSTETKPTLCAAILVHCSIRDWTWFCYRCTSSNSKISRFTVHKLSDSLQIYFFPLWKADQKISGIAAKFARCVWMEAVSGKKKLLIQKYLDTSGWCLICMYTVYTLTKKPVMILNFHWNSNKVSLKAGRNWIFFSVLFSPIDFSGAFPSKELECIFG